MDATRTRKKKKREFQSFELTSSETGEITRGVDDLLSLVTFNIITEAIILLYVGARLSETHGSLNTIKTT